MSKGAIGAKVRFKKDGLWIAARVTGEAPASTRGVSRVYVRIALYSALWEEYFIGDSSQPIAVYKLRARKETLTALDDD